MLKEIGHFIRNGRKALPLQKELSRADFSDLMLSRADEQGYAELRRDLVGDLTGRVLEVGCMTGLMFRHYGPDARVEAIEPEADFRAMAVARAAETEGRIRAVDGDGMNLAFEDGSFDAVVFGLVLCSVPSVERVLAEGFRVLRPGGRMRALEHVRSEEPVAGFLMDLANPLWMRINRQGCYWNRNPMGAIRDAGFQIDDVVPFKTFDTVMPAFPMRRIQAHKRA